MVKITNYDEFIVLLKKEIQFSKLRLRDLERITGYDFTSFSRWLNGKRIMDAKTMLKICKDLDIDVFVEKY